MPRSLFALLTISIAWALYPWGFGCGPPPPPPKTGPPVFGIAPNEVADDNNVFIEGLGFRDQDVSVTLTDVETGEQWPADVRNREHNRLKVHIPKLTTLVGRRLFALRVNDNNILHPAAERIYVRQDNSFTPPSQSIRVQFIQWRPGWLCSQRTDGQNGPPYVCGCESSNYLHNAAVARGLADPDPTDTWTTNFWAKFLDHFEDASREWSAMCSEAWAAPTLWIRGIEEEGDRVTLYSSDFYFLDISGGFSGGVLFNLATRKTLLTNLPIPPVVVDYCDADETTSTARVPPDCGAWRANPAAPDTINVHLVGAFYEDDEEVNPATGARGIAFPSTLFGAGSEMVGMVAMTDNRRRGERRRVESFATSCVGDHYTSAQSAINEVYWWGPEEGRNAEPTPNLLAHELHHVLTGYLHAQPDPCLTPAVQDSSTQCPRGFNMKVFSDTTAAGQCQRVISGFDGKDFTR
jgi:hypothetical protein